MITKQEIQQLAGNARINLSDEELAQAEESLKQIINELADFLAHEPGESDPLIHILPLENVVRADEIKNEFTREELIANAPEAEDGMYRVPRIV